MIISNSWRPNFQDGKKNLCTTIPRPSSRRTRRLLSRTWNWLTVMSTSWMSEWVTTQYETALRWFAYTKNTTRPVSETITVFTPNPSVEVVLVLSLTPFWGVYTKIGTWLVIVGDRTCGSSSMTESGMEKGGCCWRILLDLAFCCYALKNWRTWCTF